MIYSTGKNICRNRSIIFGDRTKLYSLDTYFSYIKFLTKTGSGKLAGRYDMHHAFRARKTTKEPSPYPCFITG